MDTLSYKTVSINKEQPTTRIGIGLRADMQHRAVVHTVAAGSPATVGLSSHLWTHVCVHAQAGP